MKKIDQSNRDSKEIEDFLRKQNKYLESELKKKKLEDGKTQELLKEVSKKLDIIKPHHFNIKKNIKSKVDSPVSAALMASDWHIGEVIQDMAVEGFNSFNLDIATHRVEKLTDKFIRWIELHQSTYDVDEVVIFGLGDMISNSIHEELLVTNEVAPPLQVIKAAFLFSEMVSNIAQKFENVRVEYVIPDNHSRTTKKPAHKQASETSLNYLVSYIASERLQKISNVEFNTYLSPKQIVHIKSNSYLCTHGNGIQSFNSIPYYGINRLVGNEALIRTNTPRTFTKMLLGHFHTPLFSPWYIMNGSLSGTSELDHSVGRASKPCQCGFFIHPKWKEFDFIQFWL